MILTLEMKKLKRTGFLPTIFLGSLFACAFPLANTALRPELFVQQELPATEILLNANGQMLSMVNLLLTVLGACILYHTEFSGSGIKKMKPGSAVFSQNPAAPFGAGRCCPTGKLLSGILRRTLVSQRRNATSSSGAAYRLCFFPAGACCSPDDADCSFF